jgi:hypothetical protein
VDRPKQLTLVPVGGWLSFVLAAEEVERRLGLTWGAAQKTVLELCESGTLRWKQRPMGGPDVSYFDLERWLKSPQKRGGKQARILAQLREMHPNGVPDPELCPRKLLRQNLLERDKTLGSLDEATLKKAIEKHNIRIDPNKIVSD